MDLILNKVDLKDTLLANFKSAEAEMMAKTPTDVWLRRIEARKNFESLGFPTTKNEEWKYTNMLPSLKKDYYIGKPGVYNQKDIAPFLFENLEANVLVFVNGFLCKELSKIISPEDSITIKNISDAEPDILQKYFAKYIAVKDAFSSLNTAYANQGAYIKIGQGKTVEAPVILHYISDSRSENSFIQIRNLIVAEENSNAKIIESYNTLGEHASFTNAFTDIILQKDAHVEYYKIQNESPDASHVGTTQVVHEAKSTFSSTAVTLNGNIIRNNLNILLNAEHCESTLYGLYFLNGNQHVDTHSYVEHAMPNCYSNELYKGLLDGKSSGVFNGKIFVKPDAQKTNAFQSNKNILLSKDAAINTKPQLEIYADDVKCSHGATTGQFDKEPLFYLRSRGLKEESAKAMLIQAFAHDIIAHIKIESLRENLLKLIGQRLTNK